MDERSGCAGFTLIELLGTVAVASVLLSLAAPAMSDMANSMKLSTAGNSFFSSLLLARSEAIKRNSRAVMCKSATGDACASSGGWEQGWIVFHDSNNNASLDEGEAILLREAALPDPIRLSGNSSVAKYLSYTSTGTTRLTSGAFQAGTFTVCTQSATTVEARQIIVNIAGRPRIARATVSNCP